MYFKKKSNILFRDYNSFGYITDNSNFGYKLTNDTKKFVGDKILSKSGTIFFSVLDRYPQSLDELSYKIKEKYIDVNFNTIKDDAADFYDLLEKDGFVVSGNNIQECESNETLFSYRTQENRKENTSTTQTRKLTQTFLDEYFEGIPQISSVHMEITGKCNEKCLHCYIPHELNLKSIDSDLFYLILKQCHDLKVLHLTLSGGEPLLHKNICDFLKKCREYDFSINLLSNLTLINREIINEMKANPLLGVQVSLYSMDPYIHDEITQVRGSFEKTKNGILRLVENNIPLQISCPILKQNKDSYKEVIKWAETYHIHVGDDYNIIARYDHKKQNLINRLSISEIEDIISDKISEDSKYLDKMKSEINKEEDFNENDFVCSICDSSICISENGNVYPCPGWQDYVLGNINESSLQNIWNNSPKILYLRDLRKSDFPKCIQCSVKEFCTMCMVRNANENPLGDPLIVNEYFCDIAKTRRKIIHERINNQH